MTLRSFLTMAAAALFLSGCGLAKKASDAQAELEALEEEYQSFDLTCSFEDVSGSNTEDSLSLDEASASSACENAQEQYAILVEEFDSDGDQKLSTDELSEAENGWEDAREAEIDTNGDKTISDEEKSAWRKDKFEARKEKLQAHFQEACEKMGKAEADCKVMLGHRKDEFKEHVKGRIADFDTDKDGKLSEEERKAMVEALRKERGQHREDFRQKHDADGDGKIGPEERDARRDERRNNRPAGPGGPGGPVKPTGGAPGAGPQVPPKP